MNRATLLTITVIGLLGFTAGRLTRPTGRVKADSSAAPIIQVEPIRGDSSLTVYYPDQNKLYVYQSPFIGAPNWGCAYSIQLSTPGGTIQRQPCPNPGQKF
jgi:hypothetical protein